MRHSSLILILISAFLSFHSIANAIERRQFLKILGSVGGSWFSPKAYLVAPQLGPTIEPPALADVGDFIVRETRSQILGTVYGTLAGAEDHPEFIHTLDYAFYHGGKTLDQYTPEGQLRQDYYRELRTFVEEVCSPSGKVPRNLYGPAFHAYEEHSIAVPEQGWAEVARQVHREIETLEHRLAHDSGVPLSAVHLAISYLLRPVRLFEAVFDGSLPQVAKYLPLDDAFAAEFFRGLGQILPLRAASGGQHFYNSFRFESYTNRPFPVSRFTNWYVRRLGLSWSRSLEVGAPQEELRGLHYEFRDLPLMTGQALNMTIVEPLPEQLVPRYRVAIERLNHGVEAVSQLKDGVLRAALLRTLNDVATDLAYELGTFPERYATTRKQVVSHVKHVAQVGRKPGVIDQADLAMPTEVFSRFNTRWRAALNPMAFTATAAEAAVDSLINNDCGEVLAQEQPLAIAEQPGEPPMPLSFRPEDALLLRVGDE